MTFGRLRRTFARAAGVGLTATVVVGMAAMPAYADTSTATANAATVSLGGASILTTGSCSSSNPGPAGTPAQTCGQTPSLSLLGTQTAIQAGVLAQQTVARGDGTSAACAGLIATGGTIQIGTAGDCTVTGAAPQGVVVNLGALAVVKADAILEQCTASSTGAPTITAKLINATISLLGGGTTPIVSAPPANDSLLNLGVVTATLNEQPGIDPATHVAYPTVAGRVTGTALDLSVLPALPGSPPLIRLTVGTVTCGPNAVTVPTPAFPKAGMPIVGGMVALAAYLGWRFWLAPRRRQQAINA
ncbi:MAG TPA: hypothetical protein VHT75_16050 [Acidimicrobiales bacterium]|jgi:hypothetical protein|nr:hypothetical protein [Acidimicrobiales bacterium]